MAERPNTERGQAGGDRNWEKTADRVADTPEATGKISRGEDERQTDDDRSKVKPVRTGIDRNVKE
jgi:hypothetical protein